MRSADEPSKDLAQRKTGWLDRLFALVEGALSAMLVVMLSLVLGNVILRYGFGTGINVSEELSRLLFIWLVFAGAVLASREGSHLNVDLLSQYLPRTGRWIMALLSEAIVVVCCVLVVWGTAEQHDIISTTRSLVMGFPMSLLFGVAYVNGAGIGLIGVARIIRMLREGPGSHLLEPLSPSEEAAKEVVA